jgi:hypothetical protein
MIARLLRWLRIRVRTRDRTRPDATGRTEPIDPRAIYLAEEAARSRARRAAKRAGDRMRPDARPDATGREASNIDLEEKYIKTQAHAIPENWRPDDEGLQLGIQAFGADGVEAAIARHRYTWLSRPERLTAAQWQAKWSAWCQSHIAPPLPIPQLVTRKPDMRVYIKSETPQWEAWRVYRGGKSLPIDKTGGWRVPTEWPPGYEAQEQRKEIG